MTLLTRDDTCHSTFCHVSFIGLKIVLLMLYYSRREDTL